MAPTGPTESACGCPVFGVDRKWPAEGQTGAFDPNRASGRSVPVLRFYGLQGEYIGAGHCFSDRVAGQTDRRMCLTRLPNSLALSDKLRS